MFFNVIKATILISAVDFVASAVTTQQESFFAVKRHNPSVPDDSYVQHTAVTTDDGYVGVTANNGAAAHSATGAFGNSVSSAHVTSVGVQSMIGGWASLASAFNQFHSTLTAGVSIEAAIRAAATLGAQVQSVSRQYGSCGCSPSSQSSSQFLSMAVQFFSRMQTALQVVRETYAHVWESRFIPVFQPCTSAFASLKAIAASIHVDLAAALQLAHVDVQLFATVGLNISTLLNSNVSAGLLSGGKLPLTK